ncbi:MAG: hypothetical protein ACYS74_20545 [Planctomycetota bacterium]
MGTKGVADLSAGTITGENPWMSAYTGQSLTWEQVLNSKQDLSPSGYTWDAEPPQAQVAVPGVTQFV